MNKIVVRWSVIVLAAATIVPIAVSARPADVGSDRDVDGTPLPPGVKVRTFVHYPREENPGKGGNNGRGGKPIVTPSCTETANDQVSDWGAAGWRLTGPREYRLNPATIPLGNGVSYSSIVAAMDAAFAAWRAADPGIDVTQGNDTDVSRPRYDGVSLVAWGRIQGGAIGVTYTWYYSTGEQLESDTIFSSRLAWSVSDPASGDCGGAPGTYDIQNIATHEFGHWVGLNDLYDDGDKDLTMYGYGYMTELKKNSLGLGDLIGAATVTR